VIPTKAKKNFDFKPEVSGRDLHLSAIDEFKRNQELEKHQARMTIKKVTVGKGNKF